MKTFIIILLSASLATAASMIVLSSRPGAGAALASYTTAFPGANENPISEGGKWDSGMGPSDNILIDSNDAQGSGPGLTCMARLNTPAFNNNQKSTITIKSTDGVAACVRVQSSSSPACYYAYVANDTTIQIYKTDATFSSFPTIGSAFTVATLTPGDTIGLSATGTSTVTLEVFKNGASQGTRTDSSSTLTGGQPGLLISSQQRVDAYSATDL